VRALRRKLWRDLVHLRGPFAAVALVIASGVAVFVTLRSMHGYLTSSLAEYYARHRFAEVFASVGRAPRGLAARLAVVPGVAAVEARVVADVLLDVPGLAEPASARLVSLPARGAPRLNLPHLRSGRWPARDGGGARREVVASDAFCRANRLRPGDRLAALLNGRFERLVVVGTAISPEYVYEIRAGQIFPDNRRFGVLWMSETALAAAFDLEGAFNDVALLLAPGASEPEVVARLDRMLAPWGGLGAYGRDAHLSHRFITDEIAETQVTSLLLPAIFLGVTAFLLHIVLLRLVSTQRDQIAVLKAFGYSDRAVGLHYLGLALLPVGAGATAGVAFGLYFALRLAGVYARFFQFPSARFTPDWGIALAAVLVAGGAALLGALAAVRRAVALPPAEAMRPESPAIFRRGPLERSGVARRLSPAARIVARQLERRPLRAAFGVAGIALALAMVFTGWDMFAAVDRMKLVHFEAAAREDATVVFREAQAPAVRHALGRLPGVTRVEPFRAAAVRLRHGPRSHRTALTGLEAGGELRRVVDRHMRAHPLPPRGLLMSAKLAEILDLEPGERVTVEALEGRRPVGEVPVGALVDELLGASAYLEVGELDRLLGEGERRSGAFLAVDRARGRELDARLKRLPQVVGVARREADLRGFEATIAESFRISIVTIVGFACVLAFGLVYNGARIALSERGRELASLRVLGFSRREVAAMLLAEQAAITLLAQPLGVALGVGLCALVAFRFDSELFRMPFVVPAETVALAVFTVLAAAVVSGWAVRRRLDRLDLVAVLKTRE
jgi:putative ABC transport system permease protein